MRSCRVTVMLRARRFLRWSLAARFRPVARAGDRPPSMSDRSADPLTRLGAALDACLRPHEFGNTAAWRPTLVTLIREAVAVESPEIADAIVLARFGDLLESALLTLDAVRGVRAGAGMARSVGEGASRMQQLTGRELEVARLIAEGRASKEIAASLALSVHTVRRHTEKVFAKLGFSTRARVGLALQARGLSR